MATRDRYAVPTGGTEWDVSGAFAYAATRVADEARRVEACARPRIEGLIKGDERVAEGFDARRGG